MKRETVAELQAHANASQVKKTYTQGKRNAELAIKSMSDADLERILAERKANKNS